MLQQFQCSSGNLPLAIDFLRTVQSLLREQHPDPLRRAAQLARSFVHVKGLVLHNSFDYKKNNRMDERKAGRGVTKRYVFFPGRVGCAASILRVLLEWRN